MNAEPTGGGMSKIELRLDFEAWAELAARLLQRSQEERLDILDERGIDIGDWMRCDKHYCLALATELAAGQMERATRYGRGCAAELERRRREPTSPRTETVAKQEAAPRVLLANVAQKPAPAVVEASFQKEAATVAPTPVSVPPLLAGTLNVPALPSFIKQASALPFSGTASPEFAASSGVATPAPSPDVGATMALGFDMTALASPALPFEQPNVSQLVQQMPLQRYASLCAEISVFPEQTAALVKKYGLRDEASWHATDEEWRARLARVPETRAAWQQHFTTFQNWLRQQPR
jgi:hypothetical protein